MSYDNLFNKVIGNMIVPVNLLYTAKYPALTYVSNVTLLYKLIPLNPLSLPEKLYDSNGLVNDQHM